MPNQKPQQIQNAPNEFSKLSFKPLALKSQLTDIRSVPELVKLHIPAPLRLATIVLH